MFLTKESPHGSNYLLLDLYFILHELRVLPRYTFAWHQLYVTIKYRISLQLTIERLLGRITGN